MLEVWFYSLFAIRNFRMKNSQSMATVLVCCGSAFDPRVEAVCGRRRSVPHFFGGVDSSHGRCILTASAMG